MRRIIGDDLKWLSEVHWYGAEQYALAILYGNEDSPDWIEIYARDHFECKPLILKADSEWRLIMTQKGEPPVMASR